jgi:hypothetical protein
MKQQAEVACCLCLFVTGCGSVSNSECVEPLITGSEGARVPSNTRALHLKLTTTFVNNNKKRDLWEVFWPLLTAHCSLLTTSAVPAADAQKPAAE